MMCYCTPARLVPRCPDCYSAMLLRIHDLMIKNKELNEGYIELVDIRMRLIRAAARYWNDTGLQRKYSIEGYLEKVANNEI